MRVANNSEPSATHQFRSATPSPPKMAEMSFSQKAKKRPFVSFSDSGGLGLELASAIVRGSVNPSSFTLRIKTHAALGANITVQKVLSVPLLPAPVGCERPCSTQDPSREGNGVKERGRAARTAQPSKSSPLEAGPDVEECTTEF